MGSPIDRTAKTALDANLVNGNVSDAPKIANNNDVLYDYVDGLNAGQDAHASNATLAHPDGSVTTAKIRDNNVTTAKIADGAVTRPKIAAGAVGSSQLDPTLLTNFGDIAVQAEFDRRGANVLQKGAMANANYINGGVLYQDPAFTMLASDDTAAIQSALNNNKSVFIPKGKYKVSGISIPAGTHIKGDGIGVSVLYVESNVDAITLSGLRVVIEDISIIQVNATRQGKGIVWVDKYFLTFNRVEILNFSYGFYGQKTLYASFSDCYANGNGSNLYLYGSSGNWNVDWFNNVITINRGQYGSATNYGIYIKGANVQLNCADASHCPTGIYLTGDSQFFLSQGNTLIEPYTEGSPIAYRFNYAIVNIIGGYSQGGPELSKYTVVVKAENYSKIIVDNLQSFDYWTDKWQVSNNSSLKITNAWTGAGGASVVDGTSIVLISEYSSTGNLSSTSLQKKSTYSTSDFPVVITLSNGKAYEITAFVIGNGGGQTGMKKLLISNYNDGTTKITDQTTIGATTRVTFTVDTTAATTVTVAYAGAGSINVGQVTVIEY